MKEKGRAVWTGKKGGGQALSQAILTNTVHGERIME